MSASHRRRLFHPDSTPFRPTRIDAPVFFFFFFLFVRRRTMQRSGPRGPKRSPTPTSITSPSASPADYAPPVSPSAPAAGIQKPLYLCSPFVEAALVKGNFKTIVMLPKYVDIMEWVAVNSVYPFFHDTFAALSRQLSLPVIHKFLTFFRTLICSMALYLSAAHSILVRQCPPVQRKRCCQHGRGLGKVLIRPLVP